LIGVFFSLRNIRFTRVVCFSLAATIFVYKKQTHTKKIDEIKIVKDLSNWKRIVHQWDVPFFYS